MPSINLEQGIVAIQQQDLEQGKRLLKIALRNDPLDTQERIRALTWLAETDPNPQFKLTQYQNAIQLDPSNQDILNRLTYWSQQVQQNQFNDTSQQMPVVNANQGFNQGLTPSQPMPAINAEPQFNSFSSSQPMPAVNQPTIIRLTDVQRTVGVRGGANGDGTGFFVTREGLIATSRHIVGGQRDMTIQLLDGRQLTGQVVQSFPNVDLSLIQVDVQLDHLLGISQAPTIPDDMKIVAVTHSGEGIRSAKRRSMNEIEQHWFPTLINHMKDAGGNPIFDQQNMLVGMLTSNASRSNGYMYGLHIYKIYQCVDQYIQEKIRSQGQRTLYCRDCGIISHAPSVGGYYCEHCGVTHPYALSEGVHRTPQVNLTQLYNENTQRPCPNCASQVGFYDRACMRCGHRL
ncbi:MAG: hypothetical protein Phog2KO_24550 [Phototrophicaceae bacterium]